MTSRYGRHVGHTWILSFSLPLLKLVRAHMCLLQSSSVMWFAVQFQPLEKFRFPNLYLVTDLPGSPLCKAIPLRIKVIN